MSDCRFGVSPVNYPDPDPDPASCVKMYAEISAMKKMSHKRFYTPDLFGYIMAHNFCSTQGISIKFGRYLTKDIMHLSQQK